MYFAKNTSEDLAIFAKTVGSNFFLTNRQLVPEDKQGFETLHSELASQSLDSVSPADSLSVGVQGIGPCTSRSQSGRSTDELHPDKVLL